MKRISWKNYLGKLFILAMMLVFCMSVPASGKAEYVYLNTSIPKKVAKNSTTEPQYSSDWRYWSQGASAVAAMRKSGCRVVAYSKLLAELGYTEFGNPDGFFQWGKEHKYFSGILENSPIGKSPVAYVKSQGRGVLKLEGTVGLKQNNKKDAKTIMEYIRKGYYVVACSSRHFAYVGRKASLQQGEPVLLDSFSGSSVNKYQIVTYASNPNNKYTKFRYYSYSGAGGADEKVVPAPAKTAIGTVDNGTVTYINSVSDLKKISKNPHGNYRLTKNLNLKSKTWKPIGTTENPFTGTFDGAGHAIKNLKTSKSKDYQGLFGYVEGGTIRNLTITGKAQGNLYVGAFAGHLVNGRIANCINKASVYGVDQVGGLVGRLSGSIALNCQNNAAVTGTGRCTGGITSDLYPSGEVYNCVNLGKITGGYDLNGGITGGSTSGEVANCVNFANVTGEGRCGAIAGDNASYAGSRYYNFFRQTTTVNADYQTIGEECRTFKNAQSTLSAPVTIQNKTYNNLLKALNAGRTALRRDTGEATRKWVTSGGRAVLFK